MALNIFKQPEKFSNTSAAKSPTTPAERARSKYDERIGSVVVQNYNWRRIALGLLVVCIVLSIGLTVQSLKSSVVPYVVTVNEETGEVKQAGAHVVQEYTPKEAEYRYFLGKFIQNARNIQLDPVQQEHMQRQAYQYLTQAAAQKYQQIQRNGGFYNKYTVYTIQTKITSIEKIPDTNSYQARWTEEEFDINSGSQTTKTYQCIFSMTTIPPKDDETLLVNPLGMYISDMNFSEEMGQKKSSTSKSNP